MEKVVRQDHDMMLGFSLKEREGDPGDLAMMVTGFDVSTGRFSSFPSPLCLALLSPAILARDTF